MTAALQRKRSAAAERQRRHRETAKTGTKTAPPKRNLARLQVAQVTPPAAGSLCSTEDPELWFSENEEDQALARAICAACPVRRVCKAKADANGEQYGIWGGELRPMQRTRQAVA